MKKSLLFLFVAMFVYQTNAQITSTKVDGGSVITELGFGIAVNKNSTLTREWVSLNDAKCPIQLSNDVGINSSYVRENYKFVPKGNLIINEPIVAFEIHHVLYSVFGEHIKTLSDSKIKDISSSFQLSVENESWYASESNVKEYLICVSYVAYVRTKLGALWTYNPMLIQQELKKFQISYEESYKPKLKEDK